jgi:hypothetical protein
MNYGDFTITGATPFDIDEILSHFRVSMEDVRKAESAANLREPKFAWSWYFLCDVIRDAKDASEEAGTYDEYTESDPYGADAPELEDKIYELAENAVPIQTFVQWMVFVDLTTDYSFDLSGLEREEEAAGRELYRWGEIIIADVLGR